MERLLDHCAPVVRVGLRAGDLFPGEGRAPDACDNLWLQRWDGPYSARIKDRFERALQLAVCHGRLTLHAAREAIQQGWKDAYRRFVGVTREQPDEEEVVE